MDARHVSRLVMTTAAIAWASLMLFGGLFVLTRGMGHLPVPLEVARGLGIAAVGGGQFLFMVLVADRSFPRASRGLVLVLECAAFLVFAVGLVLLFRGLTN